MKKVLVTAFLAIHVLSSLCGAQGSAKYRDPIHFRPALPKKKAVGDVMPFYWKGEYHVFYLTNPLGNHDVNWEHCSTTDLINWKEYSPALKPDPDDPTGPEGGCMFTGCIVEKDGIFHAWYTSWNPKNPDGREFLSYATSKDLIVWTKHPEHRIAPDGINYARHQLRDFRDPQIFWNEEKKEYWIHILAMPREIYAGPEGALYIKPVEEVLAVYKNTVFDRAEKLVFSKTSSNEGGVLKDDAVTATFDVPEHYMMECQLKLKEDSRLTFVIRGDCKLTFDPANERWMLGNHKEQLKSTLPIDITKPFKLQVFVERNLIECFVNDQFAQTCVARGLTTQLGISAADGSVEISKMSVKTAAPTKSTASPQQGDVITNSIGMKLE